MIAVTGRVERITGALALSARPLARMRAAWLVLRVPNESAIGPDLVARGIEEAWRQEMRTVFFSQTVREGSFADQSLRQAGFETSSEHDVYEIEAPPLFERIHRIYDRMRRRKMIPENTSLMTLQRSLIPKVRKFLRETLPGSASTLAQESAGYKADHSFVLLHNGEVKGVLLGRRRTNVAHTGLRVVAKELQGGTGWANILLLHATLSSGIQTGLKAARFEFDPELHHDTKQFATLNGARLVARRFLLKIDNPEKKS